MHAYVRYYDDERAIVPVALIKRFHPRNVRDFDSKEDMSVFWCAENGSLKNFYSANIIMLGGELLCHASSLFFIFLLLASVTLFRSRGDMFHQQRHLSNLEARDDLNNSMLWKGIVLPRTISTSEAGTLVPVIIFVELLFIQFAPVIKC